MAGCMLSEGLSLHMQHGLECRMIAGALACTPLLPGAKPAGCKGCLVLREVAAGVWLGVFVGCRPAWRSRDVTWCLMAVQLCGWWSRVWRRHVLLAGNIGCNLCLYICVLMGLLLRLSGPRPLATVPSGGLEVRHHAPWGDPFGCLSAPCPAPWPCASFRLIVWQDKSWCKHRFISWFWDWKEAAITWES